MSDQTDQTAPAGEPLSEDELLTAVTGDLDPDQAPGDWTGADEGDEPATDNTDTPESE